VRGLLTGQAAGGVLQLAAPRLTGGPRHAVHDTAEQSAVARVDDAVLASACWAGASVGRRIIFVGGYRTVNSFNRINRLTDDFFQFLKRVLEPQNTQIFVTSVSCYW
jgi:hypothetical protein